MTKLVFVAKMPHGIPNSDNIQLDSEDGTAILMPIDRWFQAGEPQQVTVTVEEGNRTEEHKTDAAAKPRERIADIAVVKRAAKLSKARGQFVVTLQSKQGKVIFTSETYKNHADALRVAEDSDLPVHDDTGIPEETARAKSELARDHALKQQEGDE